MLIPEFKQGQIVRVSHLSRGALILASQAHLDARLEGATGKIVSVNRTATEALEAVFWVKHGNATAPYFSYELVLVGVPCEDPL